MTLDSIELEVIKAGLEETALTMENQLFHSGYSPILRESFDGSAAITNRDGGVVVATGIPVHLFSYYYSVQAVLKRAGGFTDDAYPAGAILERVQVRELGEQARQEMIRRIETTPITFAPGVLSAQDQSEQQQALQQQRDQVLTALRNHPASGRLVINISKDISKWENTSEDIEMIAGDMLVIPKRQSFVLISGQVYNQAAITYVPGKDGSWYLRQAGGATQHGDNGAVFVVRANGSVVGHAGSFLTGNSLSVRMRPGDTIIVPEKGLGSQAWKNLISAAQLMSAAVLPLTIAGAF